MSLILGGIVGSQVLPPSIDFRYNSLSFSTCDTNNASISIGNHPLNTSVGFCLATPPIHRYRFNDGVESIELIPEINELKKKVSDLENEVDELKKFIKDELQTLKTELEVHLEYHDAKTRFKTYQKGLKSSK